MRLKSKRQRINTVTFYLRDISMPLVGAVFKHSTSVNNLQQMFVCTLILKQTLFVAIFKDATYQVYH